MGEEQNQIVRFAAFEANFATGELRKHGVRLKVPEQSLAILRALVERPAELVTREELRGRLWGEDTFVDFEHGLNAAVRRLREVLGDTAKDPRYVETLPKRGYRFVGVLQTEVVEVPEPRRWGWWVAVAVSALAVAGVWSYRALGSRAPLALKTVPLTSLPGQEVNPAFSPDGSQLAFAWAETGRFDLYTKVIGTERLLRLTSAPANWIVPAWSPDGRWIAFSRWAEGASGLFVIPALGGEERRVADVMYDYAGMMGIAWAPEGEALVYVGPGPALVELTVATGRTRRIETGQRCLLVGYPAFSAEGDRIAYTCNSDYGAYGLYAVARGGGPPERLAEFRGNPEGLAWGRDGRVLLANDPGINEGRLSAVTVASGQVEELLVSDDARAPALDRAGRLAFVRGIDRASVWAMRGDGTARRMIHSTRRDQNARYSPDGRRVVFDSTRSGAHEVWLAEADGSNPVQATEFRTGISGSPAWCGDSRRFAFDSRVEGPVSVWVEEVGGRAPRPLKTELREVQLPTWTRDCQGLYVVAGVGKDRLYRVPLQGGRAELVRSGVSLNATEGEPGWVYFADAFERARIRRRRGTEEELVAGMPRVRYGTAWQWTERGIYYVEEDGVGIGFYDSGTKKSRRVARLTGPLVPWTALSISNGSLLLSQVESRESDLLLGTWVR